MNVELFALTLALELTLGGGVPLQPLNTIADSNIMTRTTRIDEFLSILARHASK